MCSKIFAKNKKKTLNESFDEDEKKANELFNKFRVNIAQAKMKLTKFKKIMQTDYVNLIVMNEHMYGKEYEDVYGTLEEQTTFINALMNELKNEINSIFNMDSNYLYENLEKAVWDAFYNFDYTINGDADNLLIEGFVNYIEVAQYLMECFYRIENNFLEEDFKRDCTQFLNCGDVYKKLCLERLKYDAAYPTNMIQSIEKYIFHQTN